MNNLTDLLEQVKDQNTFLNFVAALKKDREQENTKVTWQNDTIEQYLEAALAWAHDSKMAENLDIEITNLWRLFAEFLYAGKIYE